MKRLALVASFCGIAITQMMAQNINGEQISDTTLFDKFSKELGEVVVKAHLPQYKKTHEGLLTTDVQFHWSIKDFFAIYVQSFKQSCQAVKYIGGFLSCMGL